MYLRSKDSMASLTTPCQTAFSINSWTECLILLQAQSLKSNSVITGLETDSPECVQETLGTDKSEKQEHAAFSMANCFWVGAPFKPPLKSQDIFGEEIGECSGEDKAKELLPQQLYKIQLPPALLLLEILQYWETDCGQRPALLLL